MKTVIRKFVKWNPDKDSLIAFIIGIVIVILSLSMKISGNQFILIFNRDILMILISGIFIPLLIINKKGKYTDFGLHFKKWYIFLPINFILGFLILIMFLKESPLPVDFKLTSDLIWQILYIMVSGIFEMIVFYSFMRTVFEKSFGIIPSILIASLFYSLHHAGFQPEFEKLFFVGIMYATVFRIGNSVLLIYPFFWGVGATYDVLVKSEVVSEIIYPEIRSIVLILGILIIFGMLIYKNNRRKNKSTNAQHRI